MRMSGSLTMRMLPSTSVRQMPSMVASIKARCRATVFARRDSLVRSRSPTKAEPNPSTHRTPKRTMDCDVVGCIGVGVRSDEPEHAGCDPAVSPATTPMSTPMSITQGANTIAPSSWLELVASEMPNVTSIATTETAATTYRRRRSARLK